MKELIWSYRQLYLPNVEQDASSEEYKRYQAESERAWSALEAAFGHRQEFKKEFLRDQSVEAPDKILTRLLEWTKDLDWPEGGTDGVWKSTAQTAEECCDKTAIFMRDRVWPFTKIIRYASSQLDSIKSPGLRKVSEQQPITFLSNSPYSHILCITADMSDNMLSVKLERRAFSVQ